ncbi:MAG: ribosome rescue GTPase HflX [Pseudomonadales bacterium]
MLFERPDGGERAVLVHLHITQETEREDPQEFKELVSSAGVDAVSFITGSKSAPNSRYYIGTGKVAEVKAAVAACDADLVILNHALSPSQERNLELELECRVLDRTRLILDIFGQRARTHEGKLQVELAQLEYMSTRLVRGWTHLERQKGGIGLRGGPGETQLESDRRMLRDQIKQIHVRLEKVRSQRRQGRRARERADIHSVSLVGYTNAGKSTLFNRLCESEVYAADQLFATLDPTLRRLEIPELGSIILSDTVGFIRNLPHKLVEAFRATLEEAASADLLLHVIDAANMDRREHIEQVHNVLTEIGAGELPVLEVYNKIDLLDQGRPRIERNEAGRPIRVSVSAHSGAGCELLLEAIAELLGEDMVHSTLSITAAQGRLRARLYAAGAVIAESFSEAGEPRLEIRMQRHDLLRLLAAEQIDPAEIMSHKQIA